MRVVQSIYIKYLINYYIFVWLYVTKNECLKCLEKWLNRPCLIYMYSLLNVESALFVYQHNNYLHHKILLYRSPQYCKGIIVSLFVCLLFLYIFETSLAIAISRMSFLFDSSISVFSSWIFLLFYVAIFCNLNIWYDQNRAK